jgi:soluble P-type ATPase
LDEEGSKGSRILIRKGSRGQGFEGSRENSLRLLLNPLRQAQGDKGELKRMNRSKETCYNSGMIELEIPGSDILRLEHFVSDYSGTLSEDGVVLESVREKLNELSRILQVHVITSDTFGMARRQLEGVNCALHVLEGEGHSQQKEQFIMALGAEKVVAIGNGNNDAMMLRAARVGICVCLREGCSTAAVAASRILVKSPLDAIDILLTRKRLIATLRL